MALTIPKIIDAAGGPSAIARWIGRGPSAVSEMKRSLSIPLRHWPTIRALAARRGIKLTYEKIALAHFRAMNQTTKEKS